MKVSMPNMNFAGKVLIVMVIVAIAVSLAPVNWKATMKKYLYAV